KDGLVCNLSLVMGVAGAAVSEKTILLTGLAGLVAGACSMAMGEWLSVNSARELAQKQIEIEKAELEQAPEEEIEEIALIYEAKGLPRPQAEALARQMMANKDTALDTLVREELGIDPDELGGSAWTAGASSFLLFSVGAIFPVAPFLFLGGRTAVVASLVASGVALAAIGAGTSLFTGRSVAQRDEPGDRQFAAFRRMPGRGQLFEIVLPLAADIAVRRMRVHQDREAAPGRPVDRRFRGRRHPHRRVRLLQRLWQDLDAIE